MVYLTEQGQICLVSIKENNAVIEEVNIKLEKFEGKREEPITLACTQEYDRCKNSLYLVVSTRSYFRNRRINLYAYKLSLAGESPSMKMIGRTNCYDEQRESELQCLHFGGEGGQYVVGIENRNQFALLIWKFEPGRYSSPFSLLRKVERYHQGSTYKFQVFGDWMWSVDSRGVLNGVNIREMVELNGDIGTMNGEQTKYSMVEEEDKVY